MGENGPMKLGRVLDVMSEADIRAEFEIILGDRAIPNEPTDAGGGVRCWALDRPKNNTPSAEFFPKDGGYKDHARGESLDLVQAMAKYGSTGLDEAGVVRYLRLKYDPNSSINQKPASPSPASKPAQPATNGHQPKVETNGKPTPQKPTVPPKIDKVYAYRAANGHLLYEVVRYIPKAFKQRRPDNRTKDGRIWGLGDVEPILYRLPELLAADPSQPVFICEGEKDCDNVREFGFVAVTNSGGSKNWRPEFADNLAGRHVVLLPHNDPAGAVHTGKVIGSLRGKAASIRVLELPNRPEGGGDFTDWRDAGGTPDDLFSLTEACPHWTPPENAAPDVEPGADDIPDDYEPTPDEQPVPLRFRLEGIPLGRFLRQTNTTQYLVKTRDGRGLLARGQMCLAAGASKSLKTSIAGCDLGLSLATGTDFLNEFPTVQSRVALLSGESGGNAIRSCFQRIAEGRNLEIDEDFDGLLYEQTLPRVSEPGHLQEFRRFCIEERIDVVICDPAYWCLANEATERSAGNVFAMGAQLQLLKSAVPDGVTLVLIHHFTKSAARNGRITGEPPQLEDMSQAGFAEHARQWMLLGRRSAYDGESGTHDLWLNVGGSEGHSGLWGVDVREGKQSDIGGRRWSVTVQTKAEIEIADGEQADFAAESREEQKTEQYKAAVIKFMTLRGAITLTDLKDAPKVRYQTARKIVFELVDSGEAVPTKINRGNGQSYDGFVLSGSHCPAPVPGTGHPPVVPAPSGRRAGATTGDDMDGRDWWEREPVESHQ